MDIKKERKKMLKEIEKEIKKLERNKSKYPDFENRVWELRKEADKLKEEVNLYFYIFVSL